MRLLVLVIVIIGAGLTACSSLYQSTSFQPQLSSIDGSGMNDEKMDSIIAPYTRVLAQEMSQVIGEALLDLSPMRPNSNLGIWSTDLLLEFAKDSLNMRNEPLIAILNTGGLRASINKGPITVGDMFKVMPFDNSIVLVKIDTSKINSIVDYLFGTISEPIAGFKINKGEFELTVPNDKSYIWVVTSDFLADGGDKMTFFKDPLEIRFSGVLLRDLMISAVKKQQKLNLNVEKRITW
jgi:2',3'-cyclic-nucleotide 2'-phosphodiesterase (5'-nucleotidase family)